MHADVGAGAPVEGRIGPREVRNLPGPVPTKPGRCIGRGLNPSMVAVEPGEPFRDHSKPGNGAVNDTCYCTGSAVSVVLTHGTSMTTGCDSHFLKANQVKDEAVLAALLVNPYRRGREGQRLHDRTRGELGRGGPHMIHITGTFKEGWYSTEAPTADFDYTYTEETGWSEDPNHAPTQLEALSSVVMTWGDVGVPPGSGHKPSFDEPPENRVTRDESSEAASWTPSHVTVAAAVVVVVVVVVEVTFGRHESETAL